MPPRRALVRPFAVALILRLAWLFIARPDPVSDFRLYRSLGLGLLDWNYGPNRDPTARRTPGFPAFLALASLVSDAPLWLGIVTCVASASLVVCVALLARALDLPERLGVTAAWCVAVSPTLVFYAPVLGSENLQLPLLVLASALVLDRRFHLRRLVGGFALLGVVTLIRPESAVVVVVLAAVVLTHRVPARHVVFAAALPLLIVAPWVVRNEIVVGRGAGISSTAGENFYFGHGQDDWYGGRPLVLTDINIRDEVLRSRAGWRIGLSALRRDPLRIVNDVRRGTLGFFDHPGYAVEYSVARARGPHTSAFDRAVSSVTYRFARALVMCGWVLMLAAFAIGLVALTVRRRRAIVEVLAVVVGLWFVSAVVFYAKSRFRLAAEPYMILIAVWGVANAYRRHEGSNSDPS
jgi:hypothetical protein